MAQAVGVQVPPSAPLGRMYEDFLTMQVTETLSEGLKRAWTIVLPAADIESKRSQRLAERARSPRRCRHRLRGAAVGR